MIPSSVISVGNIAKFRHHLKAHLLNISSLAYQSICWQFESFIDCKID